MNYAGDVRPSEAYAALAKDPKARLVDVRTQPEWMFVGVPDLSGIGKKLVLASWQTFPHMQIDPDFVAKVSKEIGETNNDASIYFICRSGQRSRAAAIAMTEAGYDRCFNVAGGFEGDLDGERHRGRAAGWKAEQLPWVQQ
jgi:rhodanese-related sulfurtransferase